MALVTNFPLAMQTIRNCTTNSTHRPMEDIEIVPLYILIPTSISCLLSIFGCCFIFWTFYKFEALRTTSRKLLLYLTVADIFTAAGFLAGVIRYFVCYYDRENPPKCSCKDNVCQIQSLITTSSSLCSFFWMIVISFYFIIAVLAQNVKAANKMMVPSHVICWGLPVLLMLGAVSSDALGEDLAYTGGGWCWIRNTECFPAVARNASVTRQDLQLMWMLVTGKAWEFITYMVLIVNYLMLKYFLWRRMRHNRSLRRQGIRVPPTVEELPSNDTMFIFVPIILLVLRIWGTLKFLISIIMESYGMKDDPREWWSVALGVLQGIGDSGQGFWNFVLFCLLTEDVRQRIVASFRRRPVELQRTDSLVSYGSMEGGSHINGNTQPRPHVQSLPDRIRDEFNEERTKLLHKKFSNDVSSSLD